MKRVENDIKVSMGWWRVKDDIEIGDGALDIVEQFLDELGEEYATGLQRRPTIFEVVHLLREAVAYSEDGRIARPEGVVYNIAIKAARAPKRQRPTIGDVVAIPLRQGGAIAYGHITPQHGLIEFFRIKTSAIRRASHVREVDRIRPPFLVDMTPLESRRWKIVGNVPVDRKHFLFQHFAMGARITCGDEERNGFVDVSSQLCPAPLQSPTLPSFSIANEAYVLEYLQRELADLPIS